MKLINDRTAELTNSELEALEQFHELLDQGLGIDEAIAELLLCTPFTVEFINWLAGKN
jgi:hypothetical protein